MERPLLRMPAPLDSLIGGLEPGTITAFFGAAGTGKTNIALLAALECIGKNGVVTYIDTEGGFSEERLKQLTSDHSACLKCITLLEPKDFTEQGKMIREIASRETDLIILDSAAALYRLEYSDGMNYEGKGYDSNQKVLEANRELSRQLSILSNIAREKGIPVLVTSHTFRHWETGEDEVVGGDSMKYWSKALVFIERSGKMSERCATLIKHRSIPEGRKVKFTITGDGIKEAGFRLF